MNRGRRHPPRLLVTSSRSNDLLRLESEEAHYLSRVLRLRQGDEVLAFDGVGNEWRTAVETLSRRGADLRILEPVTPLAESRLLFTLLPAVVKADAMDRIVQKATELGVSRIWPVRTQYGVVNLEGERSARKLAHWRRVARSACEQCGRHRLPEIRAPIPLAAQLREMPQHDLVLVLDPRGDGAIDDPLQQRPRSVAALVGPEGGFSKADFTLIDRLDCLRLRLGPRTLRADTAAIAICTFVQNRWGDLN
jgi:16S rRNA (uracil1498-N3)-methyltransferase